MASGRNISISEYMKKVVRADFIREFGENDSLQDYVIKIIGIWFESKVS